MQQQCLTSWTRCQREPEFVIGKLNRGFVGPKQTEDFPVIECASDWEDHTVCEIIHVGIPRAPEDFLREAMSKGHPRNLIARIPEAVRGAIDNLLHHPLHVRLDRRAQFFQEVAEEVS